MTSAWDQCGSRVRLEWGAVGAREVGSGATCVVVDVLSFTTTLSVAADRGVVVYPHPWRGDSARALADRLGATLAVGRSAMGRSAVSLSPGTVRAAVDLETLVLPSPNGSSIAHLMAGLGSPVIGACLRNRAVVARHLLEGLAADPAAAVAFVSAGERWPDGSLRPAVEDLWGAGGVVAALLDLGVEELGVKEAGVKEAVVNEEARAAAAAYRLVEGRLGPELLACSSGRELAALGYAGDVAIAAERDTRAVVPVLGPDGAFRAVAPGSIG